MTSRRTLAILYALHSWAGIIVGLWVFVVSVTGALLVFKSEIDLWANPSLAALPHVRAPAGPDAVLASLREKHPAQVPTFLEPPQAANPSWFVFAGGTGGLPRVKFSARADTGEVLGPVDSELGQFIRNIHVFVLFGPRWLVGFLGVVVLFLIGSGVVIHRKLLVDLFTLRWGRSLRVVFADVHRVVGVWGLGFHVLIAFTGAWLGLAPVFERSYALFAGAPEPPARLLPVAPPPAPEASIDRLLERAAGDMPGLGVRAILLTRWGEPDAQVRLSGRVDGLLSSNLSLTYHAASAVLLERAGPADASVWRRVDRWMEPLHFGDFAGVVLRWLYFVLGLAQAVLALSGTLVWVERSKLRLSEPLSASAVRSASHV
jgi:uncharacterized iron-regulated membrane protein